MLDRLLVEVELDGDLLVAKTRRHEVENAALAFVEGLDGRPAVSLSGYAAIRQQARRQ